MMFSTDVETVLILGRRARWEPVTGGGAVRKALDALEGLRTAVSPEGQPREGAARRLAEAALEGYGLRNARLDLIRLGFKQVFRVVSAAGEEFALRMYRLPKENALCPDARGRTGATLRSPETLREQLAWLAALRHETDLLVPEPVRAADGSLVGHVFEEETLEARHLVLVRWVSGRHKREDLTPSDLELVGSFMARLHDHAEQYPGDEQTALPVWDWHWPFGESAPLWSRGEAFYSGEQMEVFEESARRVRRELEELGYSRDVFGVIHRDLNLGNLVFQNGIVGAIDFDLCGLGHYLLDLTSTITALRPVHADRFGEMREALLEGYGRVRALHPQYRRYIETFTAMRRVAAVNRQIELLSSPATRHEARGRRFLINSVTWLRRNYL
jgi:Ser/Thr protein kinase RdoA (MazF antagonist)